MQKTELENILLELYRWNPKLKKQEAALIKLIEDMAVSKPDSKFDQSFAESLKRSCLLSHRILLDEPENNKILFNFMNMNKKIYGANRCFNSAVPCGPNYSA